MTLNEFDIIQTFFEKQPFSRDDVILGIGDDAAILSIPTNHDLVISTDTLISGVHFLENTSAFDVGYKALAVNLSDLAAMGATPAWVTLAITLPTANTDWIRNFSDGIFALANQYQVQLIGGDTTRGTLSITIQAHGFVPHGKSLRRDTAKPGDLIYVTNTLGDAGLALHQLKCKKTNQTMAHCLHKSNGETLNTRVNESAYQDLNESSNNIEHQKICGYIHNSAHESTKEYLDTNKNEHPNKYFNESSNKYSCASFNESSNKYSSANIKEHTKTNRNAAKYLLEKLNRPQPQIHIGKKLLGIAHSAIDISDGLIGDLKHILEKSAVGATINIDSLPLSTILRSSVSHDDAIQFALTSGDDYQLCFTVPEDKIKLLDNILAGFSYSCIGKIDPSRELNLQFSNGEKYELKKASGYQHF